MKVAVSAAVATTVSVPAPRKRGCAYCDAERE
jgi:hypothetical protein